MYFFTPVVSLLIVSSVTAQKSLRGLASDCPPDTCDVCAVGCNYGPYGRNDPACVALCGRCGCSTSRPPPRPSPPAASPPSQGGATTSSPTPPFRFYVHNSCHETVRFAMLYYDKNGDWTSMCYWKLEKGQGAYLLDGNNVRLQTNNAVAYMYAQSSSYVWNGGGTSGSIYRSCQGSSLHMREWTYIDKDNDFFTALTCRNTRRLGAGVAEEENNEDRDGEGEEVLKDLSAGAYNEGCWGIEGTLKIPNPIQPVCQEGALPLQITPRSGTMKDIEISPETP